MDKPTCSVETCDKRSVHLGWCEPHYQRNRKYGDPLGKAAPRVVDFPDGTRQCTKCAQRKLLLDFPADRNATLGRRATCRICHTAAQTARYRADPERHRKRIREANALRRDVIRARNKVSYEKDKPARIEYAKAATHKRRALMAGVTRARTVMPGSLDRATLEHLMPLSRGGTHTWANVVLACWRCNLSKNAMTDGEWEGSACPTLPLG